MAYLTPTVTVKSTDVTPAIHAPVKTIQTEKKTTSVQNELLHEIVHIDMMSPPIIASHETTTTVLDTTSNTNSDASSVSSKSTISAYSNTIKNNDNNYNNTAIVNDTRRKTTPATATANSSPKIIRNTVKININALKNNCYTRPENFTQSESNKFNSDKNSDTNSDTNNVPNTTADDKTIKIATRSTIKSQYDNKYATLDEYQSTLLKRKRLQSNNNTHAKNTNSYTICKF